MQTSVICTRMTSPYGFQPSSVVLFMQISDFKTRLTSLYGSLTSSVILSTHSSVLNARINGLYGFQPSHVVFGCKTATFGPEQQVSTVARHHLSFCACKTTWELLASIGPSPHLWLLHGKQRSLDQNYKSLWVPDLTCRFVHAKQRD